MRKKRFSEGQWLPQFIQESKAAVHPGFPCATAGKFLEQRSLASWVRKEMKSENSSTLPFTPPATLILLCGLGDGVPPRADQGPRGLPTGRRLPWQRQSRPLWCQAQSRPGLRNKELSRDVIQAEGRRMVRCTQRQVHMEGKSERNRTGWHRGLVPARTPRAADSLWQRVKALFVRYVSWEGRPFRGARSCGLIACPGPLPGAGQGPW